MKKRGYIFSGISQEIGNPVNSIKMTHNMLKENLERFDLSKTRKYLERLIDEVQRIEYLLKTFKNYNMQDLGRGSEVLNLGNNRSRNGGIKGF